MLSKSSGQTLRVAACLNVLFKIDDKDNENDKNNENGKDDEKDKDNENEKDEDMEDTEATPQKDEITNDAILAASNFLDVCCIHTAYMAGRSADVKSTTSVSNGPNSSSSATNRPANEKFLLLLPGKVLALSDLLAAKKFRNRGGRTAAIAAFVNLQADGLGVLQDLPSTKHSSCQVRLCKHCIVIQLYACSYNFSTYINFVLVQL